MSEPGRPRNPDGRRLSLRLPSALRAHVERAAALEGVDESEFARRALTERVRAVIRAESVRAAKGTRK